MSGARTRPRVRIGLERLIDEEQHRIRGRRIGLLAHHASFTPDLRFAAHALSDAGAKLERLFGPEHGLWGAAQDMIPVEGGVDPWLGTPVLSLYGNDEGSLRPAPELLEGLDALVIDLQDVGARYYTYAATAAMAVEACEAAGIEAIVCDRPNPIGGVAVEGNQVTPELRSFVGLYSVPQRHGLSFAELVLTYTGGLGTVMAMEGWRRAMWFDQTGLPWIPPSPNMPTLTTASLYPGQCLFEGTTLSEGRGTTTPFELIGAPDLVPFELAKALDELALPGVRFRPHVFMPTFQKHATEACGGVQLIVTDREALRPVALSVAILCTLAQRWPQALQWRTEAYEFVTDRLAIDLLLGEPGLRERIEAGQPWAEVVSGFSTHEQAFRERRREFLLYD